MKKILLIICLIFFANFNPSFADDFSTSGDLWENFGDSNAYGQKPVTDEEFEKALTNKKKRFNFFGKEIKDKNIPKGEEFRQSDETEFLNSVPKEPSLLLVPAEVVTKDNKIIPVGHYKIVGEKIDDEIYLKFYQAHNLVAQLKATETNDDFNQKTVNFADWIELGDFQIRFIYGSIDYNAYADAVIVR